MRVTETGTGRPVPLVAHVIHRLDVGGMENGLVNLINHMPPGTYRHSIVCMTDYTDFSRRISRDDVTLHSLYKREGKDLRVHLKLRGLLQALRPDIVHTRNLATLEAQITAALSGVKARVHGEHGWDVGDLDGSRGRNRLMRRLVRPLVGRYVALSRHQMTYLTQAIGVPTEQISHICNGVDIERFRPVGARMSSVLPEGFAPPDSVVIGTVMRMQSVKAPGDLAQAFITLRERMPAEFPNLRLIMVGDGPLLEAVSRMLGEADASEQVWLPGARVDVPDLMRAMDVFVLPSLAEGICNTILEAMATGLPVIATDVGGNPDLVEAGQTGMLLPAGNPDALAEALAAYVADAERREREGRAARARAEKEFSMEAMVRGYMDVYSRVLRTHDG
jgi:sugar transferase (PEP-CTERM/EpsH1 system associated)